MAIEAVSASADPARTWLCGEVLLPKGPPRAAVALSHAMMVDRRTLDMPPGGGLLSALVAAGAAVLWFDARGHGQSVPSATAGARWDYDALVDDTAAIARYLAQRFPALPRVAVGHSLFAHVALAHQARASLREQPDRDELFDALVLLGGNVWLRQLEPSRRRWLRKRLVFGLLQALARPLGYLPLRRARLGTADEPYPYLAQMWSWLGDVEWSDRAGRSYCAGLPRVRAPLLSISGAGDRLLAVSDCQQRLVHAAGGPVTHWIVGRQSGYACDPDHMGLVLDARLQPLWREIAAWVVGLGAGAAAPDAG